MHGESKDHLAWAKAPRSDFAAKAVMDLAKRDRRFAAIARILLEDGIIAQSGRLLVSPEGKRL